ncbi:hypothetical protein L226DRAFT_328075 [Lentinus tigrinus ALCF2SS1-7]|uniref:Uncharacterized protein n=1 Tax=Lentinus tigrinus ALCF2SS1-6 TaxID=1328759 RepID=A0A5C2SH75_9APHY|nr:hypothetical protein L227DRAFT_430763 [Lentinus tigrinus ALCF2SS1-6]RPD77644.1 hypothetical protein L226DRAFT_328075 [Lentinus tigrinus ALCF2SS1-7]
MNTPAQARMSAMRHTPISIIASCTTTVTFIHTACIPFPSWSTSSRNLRAFVFRISRFESSHGASTRAALVVFCCSSWIVVLYHISLTTYQTPRNPSHLHIPPPTILDSILAYRCST